MARITFKMKHIMLQAIFHFLNTEFVCNVDKYHPPQWHRNDFGQGGVAENISFVLPQNCKATSSTKKFNGSTACGIY